jgi:UDP-GlcNAc:undecaprenyl-phosphate GlcNAc-1-phosphate transferase
MILSLTAFLVCIFLSMGGILLILSLGKGKFAMDHPDMIRKFHLKSVPRIGGLSIYLAFSLVFLGLVFLGRIDTRELLYCYLGSSIIFLLGIVDDFRPLGAKIKLLGQFVIANLAYLAGIAVTTVTYPVGSVSFELGVLGYFVTIFWLIAVPNIINLIDGIDGLAGGIGMVLYLTLGYVSWQSGQGEIAILSFGMAGALLGFLCFNFPPAKIFLGDGGAYLIGFGVASLSTQSANKGSVLAVLLVVVIALGLPIMDAAFALLRRAIRGFPLFRADAEHIHHRLMDMGLSDRRIVLGMYLVTVFFSLIGLSVFWTQGRTLPIALGVVFIAAVLGIRYLGYIWKWKEIQFQLSRSLSKRKDVEYTLLQAKILEMEVDRLDDWPEFLTRLRNALKATGLCEKAGTHSEECLELDLTIDNHYSWPLCTIEEDDHESHWTRVAQCFVPARKKALHKWPEEHEDLVERSDSPE